MLKKLLKKLLQPIILEILKENGYIKPSEKVFEGYDANKHFYTKYGNGWLNIITNRLITDDDYKKLEK